MLLNDSENLLVSRKSKPPRVPVLLKGFISPMSMVKSFHLLRS
nr:MAG TPA_asm: hypothetical protein [Caudoviricetes sp.]